MNIFLVLSNFPDKAGEAIEVVSYEVVRLMCAAGHKICLQVLIRDSRSPFHENKEARIREELRGAPLITILPPVYLEQLLPVKSKWRRRLDHLLTAVRSLPLIRRVPNAAVFPAMYAKPILETAIRKERADIVLGIWSWEALAATYAIRGVPKFMYYGNPDHKPMEARLGAPTLFDIPLHSVKQKINFLFMKMINRARELQHIHMMNQCEVTANNSLVDAEYYRSTGHPRSLYIQNMWPEATADPQFGGRCKADKLAKVVGSVGNLGATGNTFGLSFLGRELAPKLETMLGKDGIQIDVFGQGVPGRTVAPLLATHCIKTRGWVEDIATEIKNSCAFLVLTNVSGFVVGNTRILLAWSLGACVVAHKNSALSMPEIRHMENVLLGEDSDEIARLIERAVNDAELRERIGRGGYETYQKYYRSEIVVPAILAQMEICVADYSRHHLRMS